MRYQSKERMMIFTIFVLAAVTGLVGALFFGLVADAYLHVPASVEVKVPHSERKHQR